MKRVLAFMSIMVIMMFMLSVPVVYAENGSQGTTGKSLDDIVKNEQTTNTTTTNGVSANSGKIMEDLSKAANMSDKNPAVEKTASGMRKFVSFAVQIISYAITIGLTLRVVLDLAYIGLPFLRGILGNGHIGNTQAGTGAGANQQGMMGGMGMGGYGRYGGMGGMGGYGGMMGGMGGMGPGMMNQQQTHMPGAIGKVQLVSNAALNAVAAETSVGTDGGVVSPLKIYAKDMIVIIGGTAILLTLAISGVLAQVGFFIGGLIVSALGNIGGHI